MRFLGGMSVSWRVIEWLYAAGSGAVHPCDEGLQRLPNGDIFQKGFAEPRIVPTFDLDFGEIVAGLRKWMDRQESKTRMGRRPRQAFRGLFGC
jgi:hypothetical protein